jgi:N-acyl-D-amino-acid deacylase
MSIADRVYTLRGGTVIDGSGTPGIRADVRIEGDRIGVVGPGLSPVGTVVEADGLVIAPGFIDMHSHCDLMAVFDPSVSPKIRQGITTELIGQDGLGEAPVRPEAIVHWRTHLSGLNGDPSPAWGWETFGDYFPRCAGAATNIAALVGHGTIRNYVMGMENRPPTPAELVAMREALDASLRAGACGLSTGLIYTPCVYADTDELVSLAEIVARHASFMVFHMRYEGKAIERGMGEVFAIGRRSGGHMHISHFKARGRWVWGKAMRLRALVDEANAAGLTITADQYPYTAGSTMLGALLPPWIHALGIDGMTELLRTPSRRAEIKGQIEQGRDDWESTVLAGSYDVIYIASVRNPAHEPVVGKTIAAIARLWEMEPYDVVVRLLIENDYAVGMVHHLMDEEDVKALMTAPWLAPGTDGLMGGKPHPRTYGTYPRILGHYTRDLGLMPLEEAIRKSTSLPAQIIGLKDRGIIRPGAFADLTLFEPHRIAETATYDEPRQFPLGIPYVFVNGQPAVWQDAQTETRAGRTLRRELPSPVSARVPGSETAS